MIKIEDDIFDVKPLPFSSLSMKQRHLVRFTSEKKINIREYRLYWILELIAKSKHKFLFFYAFFYLKN